MLFHFLMISLDLYLPIFRKPKKSDASAALGKFLSDCAPFGNIKRIRTTGGGGGGGEFIGKKFKYFSYKSLYQT